MTRYEQIRQEIYEGPFAAELAVKAIAVFPASRGEVLGLGQITWADVSRALRGPW